MHVSAIAREFLQRYTYVITSVFQIHTFVSHVCLMIHKYNNNKAFITKIRDQQCASILHSEIVSAASLVKLIIHISLHTTSIHVCLSPFNWYYTCQDHLKQFSPMSFLILLAQRFSILVLMMTNL